MKGIKDIHCHILYGVDDGAEDIDKSLEILREEYAQGVSDVILTPHYDTGDYIAGPEIVQKHFLEINERVKNELPNMNLYLGTEILACNDMIQLLDGKKINTLAGSNYVLVEFYPSVQIEQMESAVSLILNSGYIPVIAHCERYLCLKKKFRVINETNISHLVKMGAYMQVNNHSILDSNQRFVKKLIDKDLLHLIASDAHNMKNRGVVWNQCIDVLTKRYNDEYVKWIVSDNPQKIIENKYI